jgi:trehalose 6-phosphate synthase/phosphatase
MNGAEPVQSGEANVQTRHGIKYVPVWLENDIAHGHYEGYCKTILWPLFHYLLWQDVPGDRKNNWEDFSWTAYVEANQAYANKIAEQYQKGDLVWIHDYHLLLVPQMLRKLVPDAHIGLFMHAPFPSSEIFRCLPQRREIIEGMLGADLACFQAFSYSRHFLSSCIRVCGFEASSNSVESFNGHITNISYNPIGIDAEKIAKDCASPGVGPKIAAIREMYKGKKVIIGRDKLDVVRGVIQKLQAFYKFLEEFPEWRDKVVLIQVTAPSMNDSPLLERQVSELVSHINGEFGSLSFTPVHHYHQIIDRDEYYALLSVADLAIVSSLRDGMTASTMEFIVAQNDYSKAPLLLSEFTGSAGRLRSAIQINPWATFSSAKAIHYALIMSEEEKLRRHDDLYHQVVSHTSHTWAATLIKLLVQQLLSEQTAHFTPPLNRQQLIQSHHQAAKRLFLLDYDGTLTPIVKDPAAALPPKKLLDALERLSHDDRNVIYIISGRDEKFLSQHLGHLKRVGFSAEHGGYMKDVGSDKWVNLTKELDMTWMKTIKGVFDYYTERTSGSTIEEKKSSITWHYRNSDPDYGIFQAKECQAHLDNLVADQQLAVEVLVGKKNLEVRPLAVNKGEIVKRILYHNPETEFVFCAGDDKTDEDMFRALSMLNAQGIAGQSQSSHGSDSNSSSRHGSPQIDAKSYLPTSPVSLKKPFQDHSALSASSAPLLMSAPTPLTSNANTPMDSPKPLALRSSGIYTTTIGPSGKKTLAKWHVDGPQRIIDSLAEMAEMEKVGQNGPSDEAMEEDK